MKRNPALLGALAAVLVLSACSSPGTEPAATSTPESSSTAAPTPTESASNDVYAFGETATIDYAGSVWSVTIEQPIDADAAIADVFPLDDPANRYVSVPGVIARVEGTPAKPIAEMEVGIVVDNRSIPAEYLTTDGVPSLPAVEELFAGGEAPFAEIFAVPTGSDVRTVSVIVGMGEAAQRVFFGEAVDLGASTTETSSTPDVESMKYVWGESTLEARAQLLNDLGLTPGGPVSDDAVDLTVEQSTEVGIILDPAEAREFLEWAVQQ